MLIQLDPITAKYYKAALFRIELKNVRVANASERAEALHEALEQSKSELQHLKSLKPYNI